MAFNVRAFVAEQLACRAPDLLMVEGPISSPQGHQARYARRSSLRPPVKVLIGPPRRNLGGHVRRLVTVTVSKHEERQTDIGPDEFVNW